MSAHSMPKSRSFWKHLLGISNPWILDFRSKVAARLLWTCTSIRRWSRWTRNWVFWPIRRAQSVFFRAMTLKKRAASSSKFVDQWSWLLILDQRCSVVLQRPARPRNGWLTADPCKKMTCFCLFPVISGYFTHVRSYEARLDRSRTLRMSQIAWSSQRRRCLFTHGTRSVTRRIVAWK